RGRGRSGHGWSWFIGSDSFWLGRGSGAGGHAVSVRRCRSRLTVHSIGGIRLPDTTCRRSRGDFVLSGTSTGTLSWNDDSAHEQLAAPDAPRLAPGESTIE